MTSGERTFVVLHEWNRGHNKMRKKRHVDYLRDYMKENWSLADTTSREGLFESMRYLSDHLLRPYGDPSHFVQQNHIFIRRGYGWMPRLAYALTLNPPISCYDEMFYPHKPAKLNPKTGKRSMEQAWGDYCFTSSALCPIYL